MAYQYNISLIDPIGLEKLSQEDINLAESFDLNAGLDLTKDKIEVHFYDNGNNIIDSVYNFTNVKTNQDSETVIDGKASTITLDPTNDALSFGFENSNVNIVYNFLRNLYSDSKVGGRFFIEEISEDRTEVRLLTTEIEEESIETFTGIVQEDLESTSYFNDFRLNVRNNDLLIGVNIDVQEYRDTLSVVVKLYEPLPEIYTEKTILTIEKVVADSVAYNVSSVFIPEEVKVPYLKGPNFEVVEEESSLPTSYLNYQELFSYPTNNTYREVNSLFAEKGINIGIDYRDFTNFIHFSSAEERLRNFQYKLNLLEIYQESASAAATARSQGSTTFVSGSDLYWKGKIDEITNNFDHYDRHLYYKSGSTSWPKQNNSKPYIQATGSATGSFANEYFVLENSSASLYDVTNQNQLINTIPEYLKDDPDSDKYVTFIHMLGQHFDNIWIYSKALSDKYDNDNRLDYGISKDLVQDVLKNFGLKLYNSFKSTEDLFNIFTGQLYQTGSDLTDSFISASDEAISLENYRNDLYKRIYHNLPYLLKTKGTERGLKALIASFGIPTNNNIIGSGSNINGLFVRTIGGGKLSGSANFGPSLEYTSSVGKVRIDNTGSIPEGNTLTKYTAINQHDKKYSDDIHTVEVGYSPTYPLNDYIKGQLSSKFSIDNLIGDPRAAHSSSYELLISESNRVITSGSHHYGEFVRILKFYDNVLFKMIKDFVPARSNIDTGIIIKPHLLERNKIKQVQGSFEEKQYTGSIDTAFLSGSQAGAFTHRFNQEFEIPLTSSYTHSIVVPDGTANYEYHLKERTRYDGEFSGSNIEVYEHSLNDDNTWKYGSPTNIQYKGGLIELITCPVVTTHTPIVSTQLAITGSGSIAYTSDVSGGFVYSTTNTTPTISDSSTGNIFVGTGLYDHVITGLQTGSWYIRAFASSSGCGYTYGDVQTATISCPSISSLAASSIGINEFSASGNFTSLGTGTFVEKGFIVWSGSSTDKTHNDLADLLLTTSSNNSSTGNFTIPISGSTILPDVTHYYRAYVSSSICVKYGNKVSLTTSADTLATASFYVTPDGDTFANVAGIQSSAICSYGTGTYDTTKSAAVSVKVYVSASAMPGGNLALLSTGDQIYYAEGSNAGLPLNDVNASARLYGFGEVGGNRPSYWALIEGVGDGANNGKIITDPAEYPGNPGIFSTASICTV